MLTEIQKEYVDKHGLKRLTYDGVNDLYLSLVHGSNTVQAMIEIDGLRTAYRRAHHEAKGIREIQISEEMSIRNERCIDEFGCGSFLT